MVVVVNEDGLRRRGVNNMFKVPLRPPSFVFGGTVGDSDQQRSQGKEKMNLIFRNYAPESAINDCERIQRIGYVGE